MPDFRVEWAIDITANVMNRYDRGDYVPSVTAMELLELRSPIRNQKPSRRPHGWGRFG